MGTTPSFPTATTTTGTKTRPRSASIRRRNQRQPTPHHQRRLSRTNHQHIRRPKMTTLKLQIIPHHSLANNHRKAINHALRLLPEEQRKHPQSVRDQYATIDALKAYPVPYTPMEIFELITQGTAADITEKINTVAAEQNRRELFDSIRINVQNAGERRLERAIINAQNQYATMLKQPREERGRASCRERT